MCPCNRINRSPIFRRALASGAFLLPVGDIELGPPENRQALGRDGSFSSSPLLNCSGAPDSGHEGSSDDEEIPNAASRDARRDPCERAPESRRGRAGGSHGARVAGPASAPLAATPGARRAEFEGRRRSRASRHGGSDADRRGKLNSQAVSAWVDGPVAESYPVRATASALAVGGCG